MLRLENILDKFGKGVVRQSRSNLTRQKKNVDKSLYNSLSYNIQVTKQSLSVKFFMEFYGQFQDQGVKGKESTYTSARKSPFSYRNKRPPSDVMAEWAKKRKLRLRDEKGRFKKGTYKTIGFLIARSIYKKGIPASKFFTRAFETQYKNLPPELIEQFGLDLEDFLDFTQDEI